MTRSDRADVQIDQAWRPTGDHPDREPVTCTRYTFFTYYWDGRMRSDGIAEPGRYKLRVKLLGKDRTLVPGNVMKLHKAARRPVGPCLSVSEGTS